MEEPDPLEWLPEKERPIMDALLVLIENTISDKELRESLIGAILCEIDEWGKNKPN